MKNTLTLFAVIMMVGSELRGQIQLSGEASANGLKSSSSQSQRVMNNGRPTFGWRFDLFLDGRVTDNVFVLVNTRTLQDEAINFDFAAIRITNLADLGFDFQMGKFDMPFGNLEDRRFPTKNFLYDLPLIYEYRMSLTNQVIARVEILANRGKGVGMRLLDLGMYDIGAMVSGDAGKFHYAVAAANGTLSSSYSGYLNSKTDFDKIARVTYTPFMGLTVGASAAMAAYLVDGGKPLPRSTSTANYQQFIGDVDLDFSRGHFLFNGEAVYSQWIVPFENADTKLSVVGYYAEAKYTWFPRFYTAARASGLMFSNLNLEGTQYRWDYNMFEVEAGVGYHLDRNTIVKLVRRETRTVGAAGPKDNLTVLQLAVAVQ